MKWIKFIFAWTIMLPYVALAHVSYLTNVEASHSEIGERIAFSVSQPTAYHIFNLENPHRIVVDFKETRLKTSLKKIQFTHPAIRSVRTGFPSSSILRLVFDLNYPVHFKAFPQQEKIVLDVYGNTRKTTTTFFSPPVSQPKKSAVVIAENHSKKTFVVVIDPGHGGKDVGALGGRGTQEKNVVLSISKRLAELINQEANMRAVLTRHGDYFVPLRGRLKLARRGKADLFIAIHADSYFNDQASGASVYALSHRGATSEAARWLAKRENTSELGGVDLGELGDKSYVLRSVLIDLAQTATITDSLRLGSTLLSSLDDVTKLHYPRVEQAPFVVLKSPDIPSVLVETGFISNPKEEEKLSSPVYQDKIARALFSGVRGYMRKYVS